jgi:hypothetical protein
VHDPRHRPPRPLSSDSDSNSHVIHPPAPSPPLAAHPLWPCPPITHGRGGNPPPLPLSMIGDGRRHRPQTGSTPNLAQPPLPPDDAAAPRHHIAPPACPPCSTTAARSFCRTPATLFFACELAVFSVRNVLQVARGTRVALGASS